MGRPSSWPWARALLLGAFATLVLAACTGGDDQPTADEEADRALVAELASDGGVALGIDDAACSLDALDASTVEELRAGPTSQANAGLLAAAIVDCVGTSEIARSSLAPQSGGASEASLDCAADAFDSDLVVELLQSGLVDPGSGRGVRPDVEIEVAMALAGCLTPEELLSLG